MKLRSFETNFYRGHGYVALKIVRADTREAQILKHLAQHPQDHPGSKHVMKLLDYFVIETTNGSYDGLALEIVGFNISDAVIDSTHGKWGMLDKDRARRAARQTAMGLAYMHQSKVGHGGSLTFSVQLQKSVSDFS